MYNNCSLLKGYGFTKEEYKNIYDQFKIDHLNNDNDDRFRGWLRRKNCTKRQFLLGSILYSIYRLGDINDALDCRFENIPGYIRRMGMWDRLKGQYLEGRKLKNIIAGKLNENTLFWYDKELKT